MPRPSRRSRRAIHEAFRVSENEDYDGHGYYVYVIVAGGRVTEEVFVSYYSHCSCNGSDEVIDQNIENDYWIFRGTSKQFMDTWVIPERDISCQGMMRTIQPDDYNYSNIRAFYDRFTEWFDGGCVFPVIARPAPEFTDTRCPPELIDRAEDGEEILRLPRLYAKVHGVSVHAQSADLKARMGAAVAATVPSVGKTRVADVNKPINKYVPHQYADLIRAIEEMGF